MAAPKGNQFWLTRAKHGRDALVTDAAKLWEDCCGYFEWATKTPMFKTEKLFASQGEILRATQDVPRYLTVTGLCVYLGLTNTVWERMRKGDNGEDIRSVVKAVDEIIRDHKMQGATAGLFNPMIVARDIGLKEQIAQDNTSSDGSMSPNVDASKLSDSALRELLAARSKPE